MPSCVHTGSITPTAGGELGGRGETSGGSSVWYEPSAGDCSRTEAEGPATGSSGRGGAACRRPGACDAVSAVMATATTAVPVSPRRNRFPPGSRATRCSPGAFTPLPEGVDAGDPPGGAAPPHQVDGEHRGGVGRFGLRARRSCAALVGVDEDPGTRAVDHLHPALGHGGRKHQLLVLGLGPHGGQHVVVLLNRLAGEES